tara:strand:- start:227 stop:562 length:336 start_codon:yes stop_codon:yes gene_type:complete
MTKTEHKMRRSIAASLPQAMRTAVNSYKRFAEMEKENLDPDMSRAKAFKEHHDACKVAIAHIKLLIELAKWADQPDSEAAAGVQNSELAAMITSAQKEIIGAKRVSDGGKL